MHNCCLTLVQQTPSPTLLALHPYHYTILSHNITFTVLQYYLRWYSQYFTIPSVTLPVLQLLDLSFLSVHHPANTPPPGSVAKPAYLIPTLHILTITPLTHTPNLSHLLPLYITITWLGMSCSMAGTNHFVYFFYCLSYQRTSVWSHCYSGHNTPDPHSYTRCNNLHSSCLFCERDYKRAVLLPRVVWYISSSPAAQGSDYFLLRTIRPSFLLFAQIMIILYIILICVQYFHWSIHLSFF